MVDEPKDEDPATPKTPTKEELNRDAKPEKSPIEYVRESYDSERHKDKAKGE